MVPASSSVDVVHTLSVSDGRALFGVALGAGALKGVAHVGVLQALEEVGMVPDVLAGSSAGSLVGAFYAAGVSPATMHRIVHELNAQVLTDMPSSAWNLALTGTRLLLEMLRPDARAMTPDGLAAGKKLEEWVRHHLPVRFLNELQRPLALVAVDAQSGRTVILTRPEWVKGPVPEDIEILDVCDVASAVRASSAVPFFYLPKRLAGRILTDGGVRHPVPAQACRLLGAGRVLAVQLVEGPTEDRERSRDLHGLSRLLDRAIAIGNEQMALLESHLCANWLLRVPVDPAPLTRTPEPAWLEQAIERGYHAARAWLEDHLEDLEAGETHEIRG